MSVSFIVTRYMKCYNGLCCNNSVCFAYLMYFMCFMTSRFAVIVANSWINGYVCVCVCERESTVMTKYFDVSDFHIWN